MRRYCDSRDVTELVEPFIGSEALARGVMNRHRLRTQYRAVMPNVYLSARAEPALEKRIAAAWLWSKGQSVIAGAAAARLHGAKWIPDDVPIEVVYTNTRPPQGVLTRRYVLLDGEAQNMDGRLVTTAERTAFDIGRRGAIHSAVARLDALAAATGFKVDDVLAVAKRHPGSPGVRRLETALELVDPGAQSPRESYLRLLLVEAGFPRPQTQIPVLGDDGIPVAYVDLGFAEYQIAIEYEGEHHQTDRPRYVKDIRRLELLDRKGWIVIRIVAEHRRADIVRRVREAMVARGWTGSLTAIDVS